MQHLDKLILITFILKINTIKYITDDKLHPINYIIY